MKITLENILTAAKTEEQKKMALARIQKEIRKHRLTALIYGLVYLVDTSFLLIACFTLLITLEADWEEEFPGFLGRILHICNDWILSVPEWAIFDITNGSLPMWVIYLIGFAIAMIAVPAIIILIVKAIIAVFTSGNRCRPLKGTLLECYKQTGKMFKKIPLGGDVDYDVTLYFGLTYVSIAIPCILFVVFIIGGTFFSIYKEWGSKYTFGDLVGMIIGAAIALVLLYIAFMLIVSGIAIISSKIAAWRMMEVEKYEFEKFWAEVDPVKKAELERREATRLRLWSPFTSSSSSTSYSSSSNDSSSSSYSFDPDKYINSHDFSTSMYLGGLSDKDREAIDNDIFLTEAEKEAVKRALDFKAAW